MLCVNSLPVTAYGLFIRFFGSNNFPMFLRLFSTWAICLCLYTAYSQPRPPYITSPEIKPGNMVTFRYLAPSAKQVNLSAQFLKAPQAMSKDSQGVWSVTVGPIKPDIYP